MGNTINSIGDAGLFEIIVDRSITEFVDNAVKTVGDYAFGSCTALTTVELGAAKSINIRAFYGCTALTTVDLGAAESIASYAFNNCTALTTLIIRSDSLCSLENVYAFYPLTTPMSEKKGHIYVPSALLSTYKAASVWGTYGSCFRALEDYTVDGTTTGELDTSKI